MSVRSTKNNIYLQIGIWEIKKIWDKCWAAQSAAYRVFLSAFSSWRNRSKETQTRW